jgi:hypothetical protein
MTPHLLLKTAAVSESTERSKGRLHTFTKPLADQPGFVFAVIEIRGRAAQADLVIEAVVEQLDRAAETMQGHSNVQHRFEQVLEAINERLAVLEPELEPTLSASSVHALIGVAVDTLMFLSGTGDLTALFMHKMPDQRYQVFNLFRSIQTEGARPSWQKLFAVVLDGDLHAGDTFCVSNRPLQQELAPEELNAVLTTLPPAGASAKIRQYFPLEIDLALFVLKAQLPDEAPTAAVKTQGPERVSAASSLTQLGTSQEKTKRMLRDQRPRVSMHVVSFVNTLWEKHRHRFRGTLWSLFRLLGSSLVVAGKMLMGLVKGALGAAKRLAGSERKEVLANTRSAADTAITRALERFNLLPKTSKYLMLAAVVLAFVLFTSTMVMSRSQAKQEDREAFESAVASVENRRDQVSSAIIYKDENQARALLQDAFAMLAAIKTDSPEEQERLDKLRAELTAMQDELRHVVNIPEPPVVADGSAIGVTGTALSFEGRSLVMHASNKNAYRIDPATHVLTLIDVDATTAGAAKETASDDGEVYLLDDRPGLSILTENPAALTATDTLSGVNERWTDLYAYADRVYVLNPGGGGAEPQILRFPRVGGGFGSPSAWIRARTSDLSDAVSLAIDGTVFILKQSGAIVRFTSGSEVSWTQGLVDPPLTAATDLWTSDVSDFVYVLEPSTQRLVVYDKASGDFVTQYRSDAFVGLTDLVVDEATKGIYLLAGSTVYRIDASHIK